MTTKVARAATCPTATLTALQFASIGMSTVRVPCGASAGSAGPVTHTGGLAASESAICDYKKELDGEVGPYNLYCAGDAVAPLFFSP